MSFRSSTNLTAWQTWRGACGQFCTTPKIFMSPLAFSYGNGKLTFANVDHLTGDPFRSRVRPPKPPALSPIAPQNQQASGANAVASTIASFMRRPSCCLDKRQPHRLSDRSNKFFFKRHSAAKLFTSGRASMLQQSSSIACHLT
jgi:hypothetical protein